MKEIENFNLKGENVKKLSIILSGVEEFATGVGYQMPIGESMKLDISAQYEIAGDFDFLAIDIGVRF